MKRTVYKNMIVHNAAELFPGEHGGVTWSRYPSSVMDAFEKNGAAVQARNASGVELRFLMKSDRVVLSVYSGAVGHYHIFRGGIQGGWYDHEGRITSPEKAEIVIEKKELTLLERMHRDYDLPWDPSLIRIVFDRGRFEIVDVLEGEIELPPEDAMPKKTVLFYGSSITHGSNALHDTETWCSQVAHALSMDKLNKGLAGSCYLEGTTLSYLGSLGESGEWDVAVLELGINALHFDDATRRCRVEAALHEIAGKNPTKPVFVISPFYSQADYKGDPRPALWRETIREAVLRLGYQNVTYLPGDEILSDMRGISADGVHPSVFGIRTIADRLTEEMRSVLV